MMPGSGKKLVCRDVPSDLWGQWHRDLHWVVLTSRQFGPFLFVDAYHPGLN